MKTESGIQDLEFNPKSTRIQNCPPSLMWYRIEEKTMQRQETSPEGVNDERENQRGPRRRFFETRYWLRDLILSILLAFIVIVFLYQPVQVEGTSMMPRLENHERIFINKFVYRFEPIHRGDIVVFWYPLDPSKSYIKRVIGLPGEWVSIEEGRALVNGTRSGGTLPPIVLPGSPELPARSRRAEPLLRAGGPSRFIQRQPSLGNRRSQIHLRKSRLRVLAFQRVWTVGVKSSQQSTVDSQ